MKIAMYQMYNEGNIHDNLKKSLSAIEEAANHQADLILFPEVFLTEFFPQYQNKDVSQYALTLDLPIVQAFCQCAREHHIIVVPNIYLREDDACYDASLFINQEGEIQGVQKMVHVSDARYFYESAYYTPSNDGFHVFETPLGKIGIVVCFDRHFPESIRTEALMGAKLILVPTVNTKQENIELFEQEMRVQAFQNSVFVAMCNRVGKEDAMDFAGESLVVDYKGTTLIKGSDYQELLYCNLDLNEIKKQTYLSLRRTSFYL